jgi:response regulator of citrate/malate metabolism
MIRVLVVEDDFMVAKVHAGFVARVPAFTVAGVAHTGADAVASAARLHPDLVLLDVYLPDMSGIDVLRRLREAEPDVDVLVITAAREVDTVRNALRGGVVNYLLKPFDADALRARLEQYAATPLSLAAAPRGLSPESAELVRRVLRGADGDLSAAQCAERSGLSRVSARRYLEHFIETGQAEVRLRYGVAGRPQRRYAWRGR